MAVIAVVREEKNRPEDQDDRIDLDVVAKGEKAGWKVLRSHARQHDVTDEERCKKSSRREGQVGDIDDPRDHARFLFEHLTSCLDERRLLECNALLADRYTEIAANASTAIFSGRFPKKAARTHRSQPSSHTSQPPEPARRSSSAPGS